MVGGALAGVLIGNALGDRKAGAMVAGAAVGVFLGGLVGADMDRRRCDLSKIAKVHNLEIVMTDITLANITPPSPGQQAGTGGSNSTKKPEMVGMSLTIVDRGNQFPTGSNVPTAGALSAFADVADKYRMVGNGKEDKSLTAAQEDRSKQMRILLIGHTDDTGSSAVNAELSEQRAQAIAKIFAQHGFAAGQIFYQGAGEVFPIADNRTEEGRARNRRVEIVDLSDDVSFAAFLAARRPNVANYRPALPIIASSQTNVKAPVTVEKTAVAKKPVVTGKIAKGAAVAAASKPQNISKRPVVVGNSPVENLDFGGRPTNGQYKNVDIGKPDQTSSFSIISSAYAADDSPLGSCATDRPRISRGVKSLSTGQVIKTADYLPGVASSSWSGSANGHLVGLAGVAVLRDGGQPASRPTFFIWKNFVSGSKASPDLKTIADVNAYQGDKALLYRVFLTEGPIRCIDMVIPKGAPNTAPASNIFYDHNSEMYQADYAPTIVR
jgi:outer membrane protein OmpA-like peptidoglycan-associated protein